jgi:hypothetical protein
MRAIREWLSFVGDDLAGRIERDKVGVHGAVWTAVADEQEVLFVDDQGGGSGGLVANFGGISGCDDFAVVEE